METRSKVFSEKFIHKFFWRSIINFGFSGFGRSSWAIKSFLSQERESFIFRKIRNIWEWVFFIFRAWKFSPGIYESSVSWSIKNFSGILFSQNIRNAFIRKNIRNFLILKLESSIFGEYKKFSQGGFFFVFWNIRSFLGFPFPEI